MHWADGMLYPILHRLEKRELVQSYWGEAASGRKRKYYRLHPSGKEELAALRAHWAQLHRMFHRLEGEPSCSI